MAITTHSATAPAVPQPNQSSSEPAASATAKTASALQADARVQLNASILEASLTVSLNSKNQPLALLFKSAIDQLNVVLKPDFGDNAIQNAVNQDNTPAGTSSRIVSLSTAFFEAYKLQHPGESNDDTFNSFMATIRRGFEKGFAEAKDILQGLGVLNGDIAANIDKTYQLVVKGYADFEAAHSQQASGSVAAAA